MSGVAGIQLTTDLGKYLGVPLIHKRPSRETYNFILERTQKRLSSWKANTLSLAGRVTLAKSVVSALPTYCMQTMCLPQGVCDQLDKLQRGFIWGSGEGVRRMSQVSWEVVCRDRDRGGLGFRRMYDHNQAMVMKLGWGLMNNTGSLWARVIRGKYGCGDGVLPVVRKRSRESLAWQGIRKTWEVMYSGCQWKVGDGRSVKFWKDSWLVSRTILLDNIIQPVPVELPDFPLSHFFEDGRGWKSYIFSNFLPCRLVNEIVMAMPPATARGADHIFWGRHATGVFTTKSAYDLIREDDAGSQGTRDRIWRQMWRINCPQRVRVFVWKLLNQGLLTNVERAQRHMAATTSCPLCNSHDEGTIHLLRDCAWVHIFWRSVPGLPGSFFSQDFHVWFRSNLQGRVSVQSYVDWPRLFVTALWGVWYLRNEWVFGQTEATTAKLWGVIRSMEIEHQVGGDVSAQAQGLFIKFFTAV